MTQSPATETGLYWLWGWSQTVWIGHKYWQALHFDCQKYWKQYDCGHNIFVVKKNHVIFAARISTCLLWSQNLGTNCPSSTSWAPSCDTLYVCKYQQIMKERDDRNGLTIPSPRHKLGNHGFTTEVPTAAAFPNALQWIVMQWNVLHSYARKNVQWNALFGNQTFSIADIATFVALSLCMLYSKSQMY